LPGQPIDDALKHEIDGSRFGNRERNRLESLRFHGVSDTPDCLVAQRGSWWDHGFLFGGYARVPTACHFKSLSGSSYALVRACTLENMASHTVSFAKTLSARPGG
jgi:hypothetical protein